MHLVLDGLIVPAIYALFVFVKPDHACGCDGRCPGCRGTGRRFWPGARLLRAGAALV
jgi:hypothetical protein